MDLDYDPSTNTNHFCYAPCSGACFLFFLLSLLLSTFPTQYTTQQFTILSNTRTSGEGFATIHKGKTVLLQSDVRCAMVGHKCPSHKAMEVAPPGKEGNLENLIPSPGENTSTNEQPQADKSLSLPVPTDFSYSPVQLSVTTSGDGFLNASTSEDVRDGRPESMTLKRVSPLDAATVGTEITITAGAVLRKRGLEKPNSDSDQQDSSTRRVVRRQKLATDHANNPTAASSSTLSMLAAGMENERRLASNTASPTVSALPTLSNRLKLSEGLSCIDYLPAFRALAIGSTRQLHIVEVIPAVAYDVYRCVHEQLSSGGQRKGKVSLDMDNKDPAPIETSEKDGGEDASTRTRGASPTHAALTSECASPGVGMPAGRSGGGGSTGAADSAGVGNQSREKCCSESANTALDTSEIPAIHTFTSFCRRNASSGPQPFSANSSSPYVLRNAGVFGALMKVESVAWYPSCNEASVAFVQPGRTVTIFLDTLLFKSDGSYVSQQLRRSQGKGKTLHAALSVGGGSTATAVVAPFGFMLSSWPTKTSQTTSLSTPAWNRGGNVPATANPAMGSFTSFGNAPEQISVERNPGGVSAKELIELTIDCAYVRVECIAWDPHNPHTLALSSTLTHFELWHIPSACHRVYAPQLVLRPPAHNTRSLARSLAFSPSDANLIIVVVESASAGQVLLFDRRQVEVPRSLDVMGPGLAVAFHPIFSDLLAVSFRKAKTKTDCRVAFLRVLEDRQQAELAKTSAPASTLVGDASCVEVLSLSTSSTAVGKASQPLPSGAPQGGRAEAGSGALPLGAGALLPAVGVGETPRVVQQDVLQPIDHYASVNRLQWRPGSCGMRLSATKPDHHFRCWFPGPEPFAALGLADAAGSCSSLSYVSGPRGAARRGRDKSQEFAEDAEGVTPEREEALATTSYAHLKSGMELLASQLWFATAATTTDSDVCVWDAASGFVPVCVAAHQFKDRRELNDFVWVNELTLVTVFKSGEVICTCLMNNNHFEDSTLVCPSLGVNEGEAVPDPIVKKSPEHMGTANATTPNAERVSNSDGHMLLCYPADDAVRVLSLHSIMTTSAVTSDLFGRSFVVRNTSSRLKDYYQRVIQSERRDLIRRLLIQVGNEEVQREQIAQRRGIRIRSQFSFKDMLDALFGGTKCNSPEALCDIVEQSADDKSLQSPHMEATGCGNTASNAESSAAYPLFPPNFVSSRERMAGTEQRERNIEAGNGIESLSAARLNETLTSPSPSQSAVKPRRRQRNAPTQFISCIFKFLQHPLSRGRQGSLHDINGADSSMVTAHMGSVIAAHDVRLAQASVQGGQPSQSEPIEIYRPGTATGGKNRVSTDTTRVSSPVGLELRQQQPHQGGPVNMHDTYNLVGRANGNSDASCPQGVVRHPKTLSDVSSAGQRNKASRTQDCFPQRPNQQTLVRSFPMVNTIPQGSPDCRHMAIFPLISSPTTAHMEQGLTAPASPRTATPTLADGLAVIKYATDNPLEREPSFWAGDHESLVLSKEEILGDSESRAISSMGTPLIKRDKMGPLVLARAAFPQTPKISPIITTVATGTPRHAAATSLSLTPEVFQNSCLQSAPEFRSTSLNSYSHDCNTACAGGASPEPTAKLWAVLNTAFMQHCVNPVIETCVLSNAVCAWAYTECQAEANLFARYALEWDMGYELALTMRHHRHWLDDEAEKEESNYQRESQEYRRKPPIPPHHRAGVTKFHTLPETTSQPQQYVLFSSPKKIDIIFSNMMWHNCCICETGNDTRATKANKSSSGVGNDDDDRSPQDPRAQFWRAASHAWRTHNLDTILSVTTSQLEYTSLMGDVQYSLVLYVLFCLWWRLRHDTPHHTGAAFPFHGDSLLEHNVQLGHRRNENQQGRAPTWQYPRTDLLDDASNSLHTSPFGQTVGKDRTELLHDFPAITSCPLLPGRSPRPQGAKPQGATHVPEVRGQERSQLALPKTNTLFSMQADHPTQQHENPSIKDKSAPNSGHCGDTSCTPEQWKLRALQWLEVYTSELYACKLYVPLNELLLIIPELFQEPYNPVQPRAADIAYEKQMTYVFCDNCTKSELYTFPVKSSGLPAYSSSPITVAASPLKHQSSSIPNGTCQESALQWEKKTSSHTPLPTKAVSISESSKTLACMRKELQPSQIGPDVKDQSHQLHRDLPWVAKKKLRRGLHSGPSAFEASQSETFFTILDDSDGLQESCQSGDSYSIEDSGSFSRTSSTRSLPVSTLTENLTAFHSGSSDPSARWRRAKETAHGPFDVNNAVSPPARQWRGTDDGGLGNGAEERDSGDALGMEKMSIPLLAGHSIPNNAVCRRCHNATAMSCVVCEEVVEGLYYWLRSCGHGGHVHHIQQWMTISNECPRCGVPITSAAARQ